MKHCTALASLIAAMASSEVSSFGASTSHRNLAIGDFDLLNEVFENASIVFPEDYELSENVGIATLNMNIRNLKCYDLSIGDITVAHEDVASTVYVVDIAMSELDLTCEMEYDYKYGVLSGDGWVQIRTDGNSASSTLKFTSLDFNQASPVESTVEQCFSDVKIKRMDFEEDLASEILEIFQGVIRSVVENAIGDVACSELSQIGTSLVGNMVQLADQTLEPYIEDLGESFTDPLFPERNLKLPPDLKALDLQDSDGAVSRAFNEILHFIDTTLGTRVSDPDSMTMEGIDLAINVMLRSLVLDEDQALTVDASALSMLNPVLFEGHDRITKFTITLNRIRVFGLDSFTRFNSFRNIGRHTIQNELTWDSITIELDLTVDIKPSMLEDAILQDPTSPGISERISMGFTVEQVDAEASFLLVMDQDALGAMELGPLLYTDNLLPCLLSVVHTIEIAGLDVNPTFVNEPYLNGFVSPGLNRVLTDAAGAAFAMYAGVLRNTIPGIFQSSIRELINTSLLDAYESKSQSSVCPDVDPVGGYIDFRNFFDPSKMTYGDVPPLLKKALDTELLDVNPNTGRPRINEIVVAPLTKAQSGNEGTLRFPLEVVNLEMSEMVSQFGLKSLDFKVFDPAIENMDTLGAPVKLLEPNSTDAHVLDSHAAFGSQSKRFRLGLKALFKTEGDPLLQMSNNLDIFVEFAESEVWAAFMAKLNSESLFNFPLRDVTNLNCWLSIFAAPDSIMENKETGFSFHSFLLSAPSLSLNVSCTQCSSPSLMILPEILSSFDAAGISDILEAGLVMLGLDLLQGDFPQRYINAVLLESRKHCPHSPEYVGTEASSPFPTLHSPSLSYASLETIAFALFLALEAATVVAAEAHTSYNTNTTTSLSAQTALAPSDRELFVDFSSLGSSFEKWGFSGMGSVNDYLSEDILDPMGSNGNDMRVNTLLRSSILGDKGYVSLPFEDLHVGANGMEISVKEVNVIGLDSITDMNILNALAPQTLKHEITWKSLQLELVLTLMATDSINSPNTKQAKQDLKITLELSNVKLSMSLFLALNKQQLGSLELQSMLKIQSILPCLLSTAQGAYLTELEVTPGSIALLSIDGFQTSDVQNAAAESTRLVLKKYGDKITKSVPKIFDSTVRTLINNWMEYHMNSKDGCASIHSTSEDGYVDLRELLRTVVIAQELGGTGLSPYGDLFRMLLGFVQNLFKTDELTGLSTLNEAVVVPLTEALSDEPGKLSQANDLFNGGTKVKVGALDANVRFRVYGAKVENLDTIGDPLELFGGVVGQAYELNNTISFGVKEEPLKFSSMFLIDLDGADLQISNEISFSLELFNANVMLSSMTKIAESKFFGFPLRDLFNLNCWLATIPAPTLDSRGIRNEGSAATAGLVNLDATIGNVMVTAQCTNCSSPRMSELTALLSDPEAQEETTDVANAFLGYVTDLLGGNFVQVQLDRLLNDAALKCPHDPSYDPNQEPTVYDAFQAPNTNYSTSYLILLGGLTIAGIILFSALVFAIHTIVRRRHKKWVARLPSHQVKRLALQQEQEAFEEHALNSKTASMFKSKEIPFMVRWAIPFVILLNIALFLSGHLSLGATVNIEAQVAGESFTLENFFEFSIAQSTIDIWNAGGRALAILILIFSGIWPYTKLLLTFALWFASPSSVSVSRRGSILLWLDWLAKWSMIDIFVLVISIAAFRVSITSPDASYLPEDFYSVEMMVIPLWGLYANMLAQLVSQISSHVIIHYHRKICSNATYISSADFAISGSPRQSPVHSGDAQVFRADMEKSEAAADCLEALHAAQFETIATNEMLHEALCKHQFSRPHRGETEKLVARSFVNKLLLFSAICLTILIVIGCTLPSFSLELFGLVGVAVEYGQDSEDATRYHSIFSVVRLLFDQAEYLGTPKDYIGLGILSVLFLCTLLVVPAIQTGFLLKQWFSETTNLQKEKMAVRLEMLQAWQYLDVYLVALLVSSWQLGPVSDFMINSYCENLENMFAQMVYYGVLKEEDAQCFSVSSQIEYGAFFLAAGALLLGFLSSFVFKATSQYLKDVKERARRTKQLERCNLSVDGTSHSDDEGEVTNIGFSGTIHPPPVLFTDSFRWLLKPNECLPSSSSALFGDPNNNHWSLPEARAIDGESPDEYMIKGTYISNLDQYNSKLSSRSPGMEDSLALQSKEIYQSRPLTCDKSSKVYSYARESSSPRFNEQSLQALEMDQQSIPSKMSSVGSSFKDEASLISEADSLNYSLPSSQIPLPPDLARKASLGSSVASTKKPTPPSVYRLASLQHPTSSAAPRVSPFASYFDHCANDDDHSQKPKAKANKNQNLKQPPPSSNASQLSSIKRAPQPKPEEIDDEFTQISIDDTEPTTDYFKTTVFTKNGRSGII